MRLQGFAVSLFSPGQRVCCALSGGADSTALLLALLEANGEKDSLGVVLSAVHVHHGLRGPEADADEAFVRGLCAAHSIPLEVHNVDTPARQAAEQEGLEEAARELRYGVFQDILAQHRADAVATAHTLDDQAETVLMKLLRGAWTEGLGGISPSLVLSEGNLHSDSKADVPKPPTGYRSLTTGHHLPVILRPMLATTRAEVERFLRERNQPWRTDSSNADLSLTRNRLRHHILPALRGFNPNLDQTFARTAAIARDEEAFWQTEVARLLPGMLIPGKPVRGGGRSVSTAVGEQAFALELDRLKPLPHALCRRLLRAAAARLGCRLGADDTEKLMGLAGLSQLGGLAVRNGTRLDLGSGLRAERSLRELRLSRSASTIPKKV